MIGTVVLYVLEDDREGDYRPALIVDTVEHSNDVHLTVFLRRGDIESNHVLLPLENVPFDPEKMPGTWHYKDILEN